MQTNQQICKNLIQEYNAVTFEPITVQEIDLKTFSTQEVINTLRSEIENINTLKGCVYFLSDTTKTEKTLLNAGRVQKGLFLNPHNEISRVSFCANAEKNKCFKKCLAHGGMFAMESQKKAKRKRTAIFLLRHDYFIARLVVQIARLYIKHGDKLLIRLNGTTDMFKLIQIIYRLFPFIQFNEYTKIGAYYGRDVVNGFDNITRIYSGSNETEELYKETVKQINEGRNVSIAVNTANRSTDKWFPIQNKDARVIDYDKHDDRTIATQGEIGFLSSKATNKDDRLAIENKKHSFFFNQKAFINLLVDTNKFNPCFNNAEQYKDFMK